jgi:hypothetical protein
MKKFLFSAAFALLAATSHAQFNDSTFYHLNLTSTGNLSKTDAGDALLLNNGLGFNIKKKDLGLNFISKYVHGEQDRTLINNDFNAAVDATLRKTIPHFYYWGYAGYTTSFSLKINNQAQAGAGVAYNIIDREDMKLNLSEGVLYEYNDVFKDDTVRTLYSTARNSIRLSFRYTHKELLKFETVNFLQNALTDGSDYIIKSNTTLSLRLRKWLSFTTGFAYNKFSITEKENLLFTYGLTIDKYF